MRTGLIAAALSPLLLLGCSSGKSADSSDGEPFSTIGDPVGQQLGEALFILNDRRGTFELRLWTYGPNPAGSPVSCGESEHPAGTRLVPLGINVSSAGSKSIVGDIDIQIATSGSSGTEPLLLSAHPENYEPTCPPTPAVHLDGLKVGWQHVVKGVAVVKQGAGHVSLVLTDPDGSVQRMEIKV